MNWEPSEDFLDWKGCIWCKRYSGLGECSAYPKGIPEPLISGQSDHMVNRPGDDGLIYVESSKIQDLITGEETPE